MIFQLYSILKNTGTLAYAYTATGEIKFANVRK